MPLITKPKEITLKLMSDEIGIMIDELERTEHNIFEFLNYQKIIDKLRKSLEEK